MQEELELHLNTTSFSRCQLYSCLQPRFISGFGQSVRRKCDRCIVFKDNTRGFYTPAVHENG